MAVMPLKPLLDDRWDVPDILLVPLDSLDAYLAHLQDIPLLTAQEEMVLGTAAQKQDQSAMMRLALHNLRYAAHLVRRWERQPSAGTEPVWSLSDAVQAGNIGLWKAAQRYDPQVARFTTYATWWIRQSWTRLRNDFMWQVRLPAHAAQEWMSYQRARTVWEQTHDEAPEPEELAAVLHWSLDRVAFWQHWEAQSSHPVSLDQTFGDDGDLLLSDVVADPHEFLWRRLDQMARRQAVDQLLETLAPRAADVLRLRYGMMGAPMTLQEVGEIFHLTRERIRQIEAAALKTLRKLVLDHPEWDLAALIH